jgi:hypothetical protein
MGVAELGIYGRARVAALRPLLASTPNQHVELDI